MRNKIISHKYDDDGNQTLIKTETGIWSVTYNAENRPIRWQFGDTVITMAFDRMGRRVEMRTQSAASDTIQRFVYDNYLCIQQLRGAENALYHSYIWDPTEPIATRPLVMRAKNWGLNLFYTHDGNKNVSKVFYHALQNGIAAHYDYAPFGAVIRTSRATRVSNRDILSENPFRFSSEYHDAPLGLIYYNYRHYHSSYGRWIRRDKIGSYGGLNEYAYIENMSGLYSDFLGMAVFYYDAAGMNYNRIFEKTQKNVESFLEKLECISDEAFTQLVKDGKVKLDGESFTGNKEDFIQEVKHEAQSQQLSGQGLTFNALSGKVDVMKCDISFSRMKARRIYGKGGKDAKMDLL